MLDTQTLLRALHNSAGSLFCHALIWQQVQVVIFLNLTSAVAASAKKSGATVEKPTDCPFSFGFWGLSNTYSAFELMLFWVAVTGAGDHVQKESGHLAGWAGFSQGAAGEPAVSIAFMNCFISVICWSRCWKLQSGTVI